MSGGNFIAHFTPSLMPAEALESVFVKREALAEMLVTNIVQSVITPAKHHALIIGPRGFGKTHLLSLVYHRVSARPEVKDRALIAWLREEEYAIAGYTDLVLVLFRAVATDVEYRELLGQMNREEPKRRASLAEDSLVAKIGTRTLIVLTENLNDTFEVIGNDGQSRFRALIQNHPIFTIVGTAQSLFGAVSLRTTPFYGFFDVHHLEGLTFAEAVELLTKIAELRKDHALAALLRTPQGRVRVRAIHHLANGTPRIYVILAQFLDGSQQNGEWVGQVMKGIDDLTPFYQNRMAMISAQQRKIVEYICSREGAVTVTEIAEATLLSSQTTSSQLKKLKDFGYVDSHAAGRNSYYELREPLMRIALAVKRHRGDPIRLFIDFLRCWYSKKELEEQVQARHIGLDPKYAVEALHLLSTQGHDPKIIASERDYERLFGLGDYGHALEAGEELVAIRGEAKDFINQAHAEARLGKLDKALITYRKATELAPKSAEAWTGLGWTEGRSGHIEGALQSFNKAIDLDRKSSLAWIGRAQALFDLGRYPESLESSDAALELDPQSSVAWAQRGQALLTRNMTSEAIAAFDEALASGSKLPQVWLGRGEALLGDGRNEDAIDSFNRFLELGTTVESEVALAWAQRGISLYRLGRSEDALVSLDKALDIDPRGQGSCWSARGVVLVELNRMEDALASFERHLELDPTAPVLCAQASILAMLHRYREAELSFDRAMASDMEFAPAWLGRSMLLRDLNRAAEAVEGLDRFLKLRPDSALAWKYRGLARFDLKKYEGALSSLERSLELTPNDVQAEYFRGLSLHRLERLEEALVSSNRLVIQDPKNLDYQTERALLLVQMQRIREAAEGLKNAMERSALDFQASAVAAIPLLNPKTARDWVNLWGGLWAGDADKAVPLRLLRVAADYIETKDKTVLLCIPQEERKILLPLVGVGEDDLET